MSIVFRAFQFAQIRARLLLWTFAISTSLTLAGIAAYRLAHYQQFQLSMAEELADLSRHAKRQSAIPEEAGTKFRFASQLLNSELPLLLTTAESTDVQRTRLTEVNMDAGGGQYRLTYEMDSLALVPEVSSAMESGAATWLLHSTGVSGDERSGRSTVTGSWLMQLRSTGKERSLLRAEAPRH